MNNEPVAWMNPSQVLHGVIDARTYRLEGFIPLYTHPSEHDLGVAEAIGFDKGYKAATAKTLTDEEIEELANKYLYVLNDVPYANDIKDFARAILRKAQEK